MATYDSLRRSLRTLESTLDAKLTTYSKLASSIPSSSSGAYEEAGTGTTELEEDISSLLDRLRDQNDHLSRILSTPSAPSGPSVSHAVQRHRDVLQDFVRDFRRTQANVKSAVDQANLLGSVRGEIEYVRSTTTDALLTERGHIDSSHRMADELLQHAHDTRAEFRTQSQSLSSVQSRISTALNSFPGINNLLSLIQSRRRRDAVILGCLIGGLLVLLWRWMTR
ncbi:V-snare-domain-containing protein [Dacryopinax primogenitus]|uniref:Golgi SNAP receptor complex member 1 n=1 Tax=Dacryopinax primogenitus (strain DJM 731) TaxID=1858805 RepID=M5G1Q7_DACPD|nr:V-snare-domain-containing protein [Dacryopinax primogenitus]EJU02644.1 V-snare-domain-containing protein [Dacryopinax primogenitus]